jgi:predicted nucleic acid-binding protein
MILVDTSVWIDHLRQANALLAQSLSDNRVSLHSMIIGELACGNLRNRAGLLSLWQQLPRVNEADYQEVLQSIERFQWMGKGIGFVDAHLLASTLLTPNTMLWTQDARLHKLAQQLSIAFIPPQ